VAPRKALPPAGVLADAPGPSAAGPDDPDGPDGPDGLDEQPAATAATAAAAQSTAA